MRSSWIRVRARAVVGGVAVAGWLMLPAATAGATGLAASGGGSQASDLAPPLAAAGVAGALGWYGHLRRRRRAERRTTPGTGVTGGGQDSDDGLHGIPLGELSAVARNADVEAGDCVYAGREEVGYVE